MIVETYRAQERQNYLFCQGRTIEVEDHKKNKMLKLENVLDGVFNNGDELVELRYKKSVNDEKQSYTKIVDMNGVNLLEKVYINLVSLINRVFERCRKDILIL